MTCLQTQDEAIVEVTERLEGLFNNVSPEVQKALQHINQVWEKAVKEISDGGKLKQKTCERMSELMLSTERSAKDNVEAGVDVHLSLNAYDGLRLIHQTMSLIGKAHGANEGEKDCCPFCGGC